MHLSLEETTEFKLLRKATQITNGEQILLMTVF